MVGRRFDPLGLSPQVKVYSIPFRRGKDTRRHGRYSSRRRNEVVTDGNTMSMLTGKTALITGGGSGIGLAAAKLLLGEGARVGITGRDEAKLRGAADALKAGDLLVYRATDVSEAARVEALVKDMTARLGRIDILVNNAGLNIKNRSFGELTPES